MKNYTRLKLACYSGNVSMSVVGNLSPLLFLTFRELYGISYSLLGLLVLINFCTQLLVDLVFSLFSHKINMAVSVKLMPALAVVGFIVYALSPIIFSRNVYLGIALGTVIFSAASGLAEVLISPVIAAIPSDNPQREMSKLHSVYAWGAVAVVLVSVLFLELLGGKRWQWLAAIFTLVPLLSFVLFLPTKIPEMQTTEKMSGTIGFLKNKGVWLCVFAIFLGGASECTMAQWCSGYLEQALGIPKAYGDIFGVALFSVSLGVGRSLYAKIGKNVYKVLCLGAAGAAVCYLLAVFSPFPWLGLISCALTGFCVSMLWPGSLIVSSEKFPSGGVLIFALMAAGGDLGASVGPQLLGIVTDAAMESASLVGLAQTLNLTLEQLGMRLGMFIGSLFPLTAFFVFLFMWKKKRKTHADETLPLLKE